MHHERLLMHHKRLLMHEEPTLSALGVKLRAHDSMLHAARREIRQVNLVEAVAELASEGLLLGVLRHRLDSAWMGSKAMQSVTIGKRRSAAAASLRHPPGPRGSPEQIGGPLRRWWPHGRGE